ncbi:MAG: hypothetical protein KatS3mg064_0212 [Tepidiforma sp.]|nr:hypothetical protein [Tepidiforma sp.]GIW17055.1 MAG: hypothetical protein KatS3mg064_0212 [Tepidiforma sp.]
MTPAGRLTAVLGGWLLLVLLPACSGEPRPPAAPAGAEARAERIRENGLATLRSRVTVTFDRPAEVADSRIPLASHFELRIALAEGGSRRQLVAAAERSTANRREVVLTVDALVTEGSVLTVSRRAFDPRASGSFEVPVAADLSPLAALLASSALTPADPAFFDPPEEREPDPATDDPAAMREALRRHLAVRGSDAATSADALAVYDAIPAATVPSPKLRAALAALTGTFAEPALADLLTPANCTGQPAASIDFREPPGMERLLARVTYTGTGARVVSIHPSLRGERFELLIPLLAHEAVHCDQFDSRVEEVAATAFDTLLFLRLVAADPTLAEERTRLARELRIDALAMVNSGAVLPESIGVLRSPGVEAALPGTNAPYRSFAELVTTAYPTVTALQSPLEPLAAAYMAALAAETGAAAGDPFDLRYLDGLLAQALDGASLVAVIRAFGLEPAD